MEKGRALKLKKLTIGKYVQWKRTPIVYVARVVVRREKLGRFPLMLRHKGHELKSFAEFILWLAFLSRSVCLWCNIAVYWFLTSHFMYFLIYLFLYSVLTCTGNSVEN